MLTKDEAKRLVDSIVTGASYRLLITVNEIEETVKLFTQDLIHTNNVYLNYDGEVVRIARVDTDWATDDRGKTYNIESGRASSYHSDLNLSNLYKLVRADNE